jgi:predicted transcriptional regulator
MSALKDAAHKVIENLPENATWEDLEYHLYVRRKVERGLKDVAEGKVISHEEVRRRLDALLRR